MEHKIILRRLKENGWNMQFDRREEALIEDIAKITNKESFPLGAEVKPENDLAHKHRTDIVLNALRDLEGWILKENQMDAKTVNKVVKQISNMKKQRENHLSV